VKIYFLISLVILTLFSCISKTNNDGQKQGLISPSGNFKVYMPIRKSNKRLSSPVWTPIIKNYKGQIVYIDETSNLSGHHNSYWDWNINNLNYDILWVYNSDDGSVLIFYRSYGKWGKCYFDIKKGKLIPPKIINKKIYNKINHNKRAQKK